MEETWPLSRDIASFLSLPIPFCFAFGAFVFLKFPSSTVNDIYQMRISPRAFKAPLRGVRQVERMEIACSYAQFLS